jgi:hypothetical protein
MTSLSQFLTSKMLNDSNLTINLPETTQLNINVSRHRCQQLRGSQLVQNNDLLVYDIIYYIEWHDPNFLTKIYNMLCTIA